jgi:chemotaxis family two-component system sensor kinase Cph1
MSPSLSASELRRGGHVCLPFETETEKQEALLAFIHEGLTFGARCIFTGTPEEFAKLNDSLEEMGICSKRAGARGALVFQSLEETYLTNGKFDPVMLISRTEELIEETLKSGFTGLRRTGELHQPPNDETWRKIIWYEARINEHFARSPFSALCRYSRAAVSPERVCDLLRTHPTAIVRGEVCDNPFYERPELALSDDGQARLNWQLRQLLVQHRMRRRLETKTVSAVTAAAELAVELSELRSSLARTEPTSD